jgi:hypothetical protein
MPDATKFRFKSLSNRAFQLRYPEALENADSDDSQIDLGQSACEGFGEVKVPGHGWCGCVLGTFGSPIYFYTDDDGWTKCPPGKYQGI